MTDYDKLRILLKRHLKIEVKNITKDELELKVTFNDELITKTRWKK